MHKQFFEHLIPGTNLFGRFRLDRCLSASHLGGVYLCLDERHQKNVVLKIASNRLAHGSEYKRQFLREIEIARGIDHPNVVKIEEFLKDEEFLAYSMEFVPGGSLAARLARGSLPPISHRVVWLRQIASGLGAIHRAGIIHRDLKPENILMTHNEVLKIADFGISLQHGRDDETSQDSLIGTVNFLSPEYVKAGTVDPRSDIYAWGVIAYLLLTRAFPFQGISLIETLTLRVTQDPIPPQRLNSEIPHFLGEIVMRALRREPSKRIQTAAELCTRIDEFVGFSRKVDAFQRANDDSGLLKRLSIKTVA